MDENVAVAWVAVPADFYDMPQRPRNLDQLTTVRDLFTKPRLSIAVTFIKESGPVEGDLTRIPRPIRNWVEAIQNKTFTVRFFDESGQKGHPVTASIVNDGLSNALWRSFFDDLEPFETGIASTHATRLLTSADTLAPVRTYPTQSIANALRQVTATVQGLLADADDNSGFRAALVNGADVSKLPGFGPMDKQIRGLFWEQEDGADPDFSVKNDAIERALDRLDDRINAHGLAHAVAERKRHYFDQFGFGPRTDTVADNWNRIVLDNTNAANADALEIRNLHRLARNPYDHLTQEARKLVKDAGTSQSTATAFGSNEEGEVRSEDFLQATLFHARVPHGKERPLKTTDEYPYAKLAGESYDSIKQRGPWTRRVAALRNFPTLARRIGLVIDLDLHMLPQAIAEFYGTDATKKPVYGLIEVTGPSIPGVGLQECKTRFCLEAYSKNIGGQDMMVWLFRPQDQRDDDSMKFARTFKAGELATIHDVTKKPHWLRRGSLDLSFRLPEPKKGQSAQKFTLDTLDVDGGAMKLVNFARSYQKQFQNAGRIVTDMPDDADPVILNKNDRAIAIIRQRRPNQKLYAQEIAMLSLNTPLELGHYFEKEDIKRIVTALLALKNDLQRKRVKRQGHKLKRSKSPSVVLQREKLRFDGLSDYLTVNAVAVPSNDKWFIRWILEPDRENSADSLELPPAHRTVGLSLYSADRAADVEDQQQRSAQLRKATRGGHLSLQLAPKAASPAVPFVSSDLLFGLVPEVRIERPSPSGEAELTPWFPLTERMETYKTELEKIEPVRVQASIRMPTTRAVDRAPSQQSSEHEPDEVYAPECLFSWQGWSLSVPNNRTNWKDGRGMPVDDSGKPIGARNIAKLVDVDLKVPSSSLPPLRFSQPVIDKDQPVNEKGEKNWRASLYEIRVATMDSTGYARWLDLLRDNVGGKGGDQTSIKAPVLRFEPIPHPTVLLAEPYRDDNPVKSLRNLSVRDGAGSDGRYIAPPRTSLNACELHGVLDPLKFEAFGDFADIELDDSGQFWVLSRGSGNTPMQAKDAEEYLKRCQQDRRLGRKASPDDPDATFEPFYRRGSSGINRSAATGYYPDPMARRALFLLTDITSSEGDSLPDEIVGLPEPLVDLYPHDSSWPRARGFHLALVPLSVGQSMSLEWSRSDRRLTFGLAPGQRLRVELCCAPDAVESSSFSGLAMANYHRNSTRPAMLKEFDALRQARLTGTPYPFGNALDEALQQQRDGLDPLISPRITIELAHAVQKPLPGLAFEGEAPKPKDRAQGTQLVFFDDMTLKMNEPTTGEIELHATWTDLVDNFEDPAPKEAKDGIIVQKRAASPPVTDVAITGNLPWMGVEHDFQDTKYHRVTYKLRGVTRFMDHYRHRSNDIPDFSIDSPSVERVIKSSVAPAACAYLYSVPVFGWSQSEDVKSSFGQSSFESRRETGIRIWMDRGWNSQGNDELLAILLPLSQTDLHPAAGDVQPYKLQDVVSRWGADPTEPSAGIDDMGVDIKHFRNYKTKAVVHTQEADGDGNRFKVQVVAYAPQFDPARRLWFCDVPMTGSRSYFGFIKLAIARYQPQSIDGHEISTVFRADFVQMIPERWINVRRDSLLRRRVMIIEVYGTKHLQSDNYAPDPALAGKFSIIVERHCGDQSKDAGWSPAAHQEYEIVEVAPPDPKKADPNLIVRFELRFANHPIGRRRIIVVEEETRQTRVEKPDYTYQPASRLVYVDVLDI
ncbi:MAG TPA: hypothetical protein VM639_22490 [Dongiaceae bacterium]|nr:hypothetical protein [Dongiaceae bacterium]